MISAARIAAVIASFLIVTFLWTNGSVAQAPATERLQESTLPGDVSRDPGDSKKDIEPKAAKKGLNDKPTSKPITKPTPPKNAQTPTSDPTPKNPPEAASKEASSGTANAPSPDSKRNRKTGDFVRLPLPKKASDGRQFIPIGVFQSQLSAVVPNGYRAVNIDRLSQAVREQESETEQNVSLRSAFYDVRLVGDTLVSDQSTWDFEKANSGQQARHSLGPVSLAIASPRERTSLADSVTTPHLESTAGGELMAILSGDRKLETIRFGWSSKGKLDGIYRKFVLRLPNSPLSQLIVSVPSEMRLFCDNGFGVLRSWPGPPPGADVDARGDDVRWYSVDAGGQEVINLSAASTSDLENSPAFLVRSESRQYEIRPSGVAWQQRLIVQSRGRGAIPDFSIPFGRVAAVRVGQDRPGQITPLLTSDGVAYRYHETTDDSGRRIIRVDDRLSGDLSETVTATVTIYGESSWNASSDWCGLPAARWVDQDVVEAHAMVKTQVNVLAPLDVVQWELPRQWAQQEAATPTLVQRNPTSLVLRSEGPPMSHIRDQDNDAGVQAWSRIRLSKSPLISSTNHLLQIKIGEVRQRFRSLTAKSRFEFMMDPQRLSPVRVTIQAGWDLQTATLVHSGRVIESQQLNRKSRTLTFWPEPNDMLGDSVAIELIGERALPRALAPNQPFSLPPTWFANIDGVRRETLIAISPANDLNWSGSTALRAKRLDEQTLMDDQIVFFDAFGDDTLLFRPDSNTSPQLFLQRPEVSIDVKSSLQLERTEQGIVETLIVQAATAGQLRQVSVIAGDPAGRPDYQWSLQSGDDSVPINQSSVQLKEGVYQIALADNNVREVQIVGTRRYSLSSAMTMTLPSVLNAASQNSDVLIGSGLVLRNKTDNVQKVPLATRSDFDGSATARQPVSTTRLRYDAGQIARIQIEESKDESGISIVWQHDIDLTASSRGTDVIRGQFRVSSKNPIQIDYEPDLQLASVSHNGELLDLAKISKRPIILPPKSDNDFLSIVWNRDEIQGGAIRQCRIPTIEMKGVRVKTGYQMNASIDSFAIASLVRSRNNDSDFVEVTAGSKQTLMPRNLAIALGWLVACITFAVAWIVARKNLLMVAFAVAVASVATLLWRPWQQPLVGWLLVPTIAAALLQASIEWLRRPIALPQTRPSQNHGSSRSFSLASNLSLWLLVFAAILLASGAGFAKEPVGKIHLLVPVDKSAKQIGNKVYAPTEYLSQLFDRKNEAAPSKVTFQSVVYRLDLETVGEATASSETPTVNCDLVVRTPNPVSQIQLPFRKSVVRQVELREEEQNRIIPHDVDQNGFVVLDVPPGDSFRLRLTMTPDEFVDQGGLQRLSFAIPKINVARLLVEADRQVEDVEILTSSGAVIENGALRRWEAQLGPEDKLSVAFRVTSDRPDSEAPKLKRQYVIDVGKNRTSIDCQIDLPKKVAVGEQVQLIVLDSTLPIVSDVAWRLDKSEMITASRRLITLSRRAAGDSTVHLFWSLPSLINDLTSAENSIPFSVPDVIPPASGPYDPAWVAIQHDPDLRISQLKSDEITELSNDKFLERWRGASVSRKINQAFVSGEQLPSLLMMQTGAVEPTSEQTSHHLHVMKEVADLRFRANIASSKAGHQRHTLRLPKNVDLVRVLVDGKRIDAPILASEGFFEIPIGDFLGRPTVNVQALGRIRLKPGSDLSFPAMEIWPPVRGNTSYTLTHDTQVQLSVPQVPGGFKKMSFEDSTSEFLAAGWVPKNAWKIDESAEQMNGAGYAGQIHIVNASPRFETSQEIRLDYRDGVWQMLTQIEFSGTNLPSFVDVELPASWCKNLRVARTESWTRHQSTDPSNQLLRIDCDKERLTDSMLEIRGELDTTDQGRIEIPRVRILGAGERAVRVSVPNRLTNQQVTWNQSAVSANLELSTKNRSVFDVENSAWSIKLAPLASDVTEPVALVADTRVFLQSEQTLVISRWDLVPNGMEEIDIRLPLGSTCLGAWAAGRPARYVEIEPDADDKNARTIARVPLALGRLSQSIELLLSVSAANSKRQSYLPTLEGILVPGQWVATYTPTESAPSEKSLEARVGANSRTGLEMRRWRGVAMANSVVSAIDQSLDSLAERPANEVTTWLLPWMARYQNVARMSGRDFDMFVDEPDETKKPTRKSLVREQADLLTDIATLSSEPNAIDRAWKILDDRMQQYARRFLKSEHLEMVNSHAPLFDAGIFDGYRLTDTVKLTPVASPRPLQTISPGMNDLRRMILNMLTLFMVIGVLVIAKSFHERVRPLCEHPSFWLLLLGIFGTFVAPLPVALAVIAFAILSPWWSIRSILPRRS